MIRVNVLDSRDPRQAQSRVIEMAAVPRIGDTFHWNPDESGFTVKSVLWIAEGDYQVQIRGW